LKSRKKHRGPPKMSLRARCSPCLKPWLGVFDVKRDYIPSCTRPEVNFSLDQRILWGDFCEKCVMASSFRLLVFCTA